MRRLWIFVIFLTLTAGALEAPLELQRLADQGDAVKQTELGLFYLREKNNPNLGAHWLNRAYRQGNGRAALYLGSLYEQGAGVDRSPKKAFECYELAAKELNSLHAQYRLSQFLAIGLAPERIGQSFLSGVDPDPERSDELLAKLAQAGYLPAVIDRARQQMDQANLSPEQALALFNRLNQHYSSDSTGKVGLLLAECLQRGIGSTPNLDQRLAVLKTISERNSEAEAILGFAYEYAEGCPPDPDAGFRHIQRAAARGSAPAKMRMGDHYLTGLYVQSDPVMAFKLYLSSLEANISGAWAKVGFCYLYGIGIPVDQRKALEHFLHGAGRGDREARQYAMLCFANGWGTPPDASAVKFWRELIMSEVTTQVPQNPSDSLPFKTLI